MAGDGEWVVERKLTQSKPYNQREKQRGRLKEREIYYHLGEKNIS